MELNDFVKNFASQFDETDSNEFFPETKFKNLDEWSSLLALSVIAMVDEEYRVKIKGDDIRNLSTIEDLYTVVKSRS
jgi:acyl carrier protein